MEIYSLDFQPNKLQFDLSTLTFNNMKFDLIIHDKELNCYFLKNTDIYVLYQIYDDIWQLVNLTTYFVSGAKKVTKFEYDIPGAFVDDTNKTICYRVAKNGSSVISKLYTGEIFSKRNSTTFLSISELKQRYSTTDLKSFFKYAILRDPIKRFESSVAHYLRYNMQFFSNFPQYIRNQMLSVDIDKRKQMMINYLFNVIRIVTRYFQKDLNVDEDVHIIPQSLHLKKILDAGLVIDKFVELSNLQDFVENTLHKHYQFESITGRNISGITDMHIWNIMPMLKNILKCDYDFLKTLN